MLKPLRKWYAERKHRIYMRYRKWYKDLPETTRNNLYYYGNYVLNATLLSLLVLYIVYFNVVWVRFLGIIPALTILLMYMEHYYVWFRAGYKNE